MTLMEARGLDFDDLRAALDKLDGHRVHVVGDTIVDSFTYTTLIGGMTKTPTISVRSTDSTDFIGGAGIVAEHLRPPAPTSTFSTVLGDDALKDFVLEGSEQTPA